jgi:cytochrome c553
VAPGDVEEAARYFAAMKPRRWIRVVETATVPVTRAQAWMLVAVAGAGREPIGQRIIEMPDDLERTERRDDRSGFVAYVPPGSIARGERLASAAPACASCHGAGLRGTETVPGIAGRSPSYLVRQLYDIANGKRAGDGAALMQPVVARLTAVDVVAVAAFVASRRP